MRKPWNKTNIYYTLGHLFFWILVFLFNFSMIKNFNVSVEYDIQLLNLLAFMGVFYANYYLLMPLLLKKKIWLYLGLSILVLSITIVLKSQIPRGFDRPPPPVDFQIEQSGENGPQPPFKYRPKQIDGKQPLINWHGLVFNTSSLFFFFLLSVSFRFILKWLDDEKQKSKLEKEIVETELAFLKQQINPHFLFNSLNSIYSLSISKSDKTTPSILKLSSILRYLLYETETSVANLQNELAVINDYIELQKLRLTKNVEVKVSFTGEADNYLFEPFIILPIIENAFKYGVDNLNNSFISIGINIANGKLDLNVENKVVQRPAMLRKDSGIGLKNVKRRLEILYPKNHYFSSEENNEIFSVKVQIKLKEK